MERTILKGTYCLIMHLENNTQIKIGKKGMIKFKGGYYVYIGSALNSLEGRIKRHLRKYKKLHWHVDYLLDSPYCQVMVVFFNDDGLKHECELATQIAKEGEEIMGFGCSDCNCSSHLIYFVKMAEAEDECINAFKRMGLKLNKLIIY